MMQTVIQVIYYHDMAVLSVIQIKKEERMTLRPASDVFDSKINKV